MSRLANNLIHKGFLKQDLIIEAFSEIGRVEFIPERFSQVADENISLPIGHGQIAPAPSVVAFMLELLAPQRGDKVLVIGSGTGWVSGLLGYIVGAQGHVTAVDDVAALNKKAQENVDKYRFIERDHIVTFHNSNSTQGYPDHAPYDCIFIARSVPTLPQVLIAQMGEGARAIVPIDDVVVYFRKEAEELIEERFDSVHFSQT